MKNLFYLFVSTIFISCSSFAQSQETNRPVNVDGVYTVAADYMGGSNGCYTINVRVYLTYGGQTLLLASSNVRVGDCPKKTAANENAECKDQEFKGDYFFYTKDQFKYCLVDLFMDEVTYAKYIIEKDRVLHSVKK